MMKMMIKLSIWILCFIVLGISLMASECDGTPSSPVFECKFQCLNCGHIFIEQYPAGVTVYYKKAAPLHWTDDKLDVEWKLDTGWQANNWEITCPLCESEGITLISRTNLIENKTYLMTK